MPQIKVGDKYVATPEDGDGRLYYKCRLSTLFKPHHSSSESNCYMTEIDGAAVLPRIDEPFCSNLYQVAALQSGGKELVVDQNTEAQDYYFHPNNATRTTLSGLAAYRSALTLDWLAAEDSRQRDLVSAFETDAPSARFVSSDCTTYPKPTPGKIGRLMLELLRNLEGDEGTLIPELIQILVRTKLLVETTAFDLEPDFEALINTPGMMVGEPHSTFPKIVAVVWMLVTDPVTTRKYGWCPVKQVNKYLAVGKPRDIAKRMKALELIVARARFVMEEFIQNITPVNMYQKKQKKPMRTKPPHQLALFQTSSVPTAAEVYETFPTRSVIDGSVMVVRDGGRRLHVSKFLLATGAIDLPESVDPEISQADRWTYRNTRRDLDEDVCSRVRPTTRDIVRRIYAILAYFDREHANMAFLHKIRGTIHGMSEGDDLLDREAAFYAATLIPIVFLQQYRDTWCLLERFHRALRLYQMSHPSEKRSALKLLQNFRAVSHKVQAFVRELPGRPARLARLRSTTSSDFDDEEIHDKKDIKYLKELIKNLG